MVDLTLKANSSRSAFDQDWENCRIAKVMAVMGPNGAGKSNILKPLAFLSWFCSESFKSMDDTDLLPFYPHLTKKDEPSEIEVCFVDKLENSDGELSYVEFKYLLKIKKDIVLYEELKFKTSRLFSSVFYREYDESNHEYKIKTHSDYSGDVRFTVSELKTIPRNVSAIAYYKRKGNDGIVKLMHYVFRSVENNLNLFGKSSFNYGKVLDATEMYHQHEALFTKAKKYLKRMDFGLEDIILRKDNVFDKKTGEMEERILAYGVHLCDGQRFEVPFHMESTGTQACFYFICRLICAFEHGGTAVIDELDSDLHPFMIRELLDMFANEGINQKRSQLIFSCHTAEVLKKLNKHNVYLVEKKNSISECWRLDDVKGLRSQDNLYAKYITGALGAVPDINL